MGCRGVEALVLENVKAMNCPEVNTMNCPDVTTVDLVLQGAPQSVATFKLRAAVDIYFRRRPHMAASGSVYVWGKVGSMRVLLGEALLPVGNDGYPPDDLDGSLILSLRNIMLEDVEVTTDGSSYLSDDGLATTVDPYASFAVVAWGDQPSASNLQSTQDASYHTTAQALRVFQVAQPDGHRATWSGWSGGAEGLITNLNCVVYQMFLNNFGAVDAWMFLYEGSPIDDSNSWHGYPVPAFSSVLLDFGSRGWFCTNGLYVRASSDPVMPIATGWAGSTFFRAMALMVNV